MCGVARHTAAHPRCHRCAGTRNQDASRRRLVKFDNLVGPHLDTCEQVESFFRRLVFLDDGRRDRPKLLAKRIPDVLRLRLRRSHQQQAKRGCVPEKSCHVIVPNEERRRCEAPFRDSLSRPPAARRAPRPLRRDSQPTAGASDKGPREVGPGRPGTLSFAKTSSGGQVVDLSTLIRRESEQILYS